MMVEKNSSGSGSDKKNDDNNPVGNFLTWLTSPLEIDVTGEKYNNELKKKKMKNEQTNHSRNSNSNSTKPSINKKSPEQRERLQQKQQSNSSYSVIHHKDQPKQFDEKISAGTKKLDLLSQSDHSVLRESLLLDKCCCDTEDTLEIEINLNPHTELPSHVPTPETIDQIDDTNDNNEPWTNKVEGVIDHAVGGIHYHFTNMFIDHSTGSPVKYGNQPKNNNTDHTTKYAPSFETPPQSPVTNKKTLKSKLLLTPPPKSSRRTKWGSEIWNAKKSSPTNSTMISSSLSTDSSHSSGDSFVGELNIDLCELANQEKERREAMGRNQQKKQKYKQETAIKKVKPASIGNVDRSSNGSSSSFHINDDDIPSSILNKKTSNSNIKPEKAIENKGAVAQTTAPKDKRKEKQVTTAAAAASSSSTALVKTSPTNKSKPTAAVTAIVAASSEIKTTPLQLRWMYENALNLQASCPRRGSIRKYDGDGDGDCEDISLSLLYEKDLRLPLMMREQCQLQLQLQPQRNISCHSTAA